MKIVKLEKKFILPLVVSICTVLLLVVYMNSANANMASCIFCNIASGKSPQTKIEVETEEYVIFKDIKPASTYHYLAVSKRHIESLKSLTKADEALVSRMESGLKNFLDGQKIDTNDALFGFHLPPFITVKHLHMHAIAPRSKIGFVYDWVFKPGTAWFKTPEEARKYLLTKEL